jgi:hypothetical protein
MITVRLLKEFDFEVEVTLHCDFNFLEEGIFKIEKKIGRRRLF